MLSVALALRILQRLNPTEVIRQIRIKSSMKVITTNKIFNQNICQWHYLCELKSTFFLGLVSCEGVFGSLCVQHLEFPVPDLLLPSPPWTICLLLLGSQIAS